MKINSNTIFLPYFLLPRQFIKTLWILKKKYEKKMKVRTKSSFQINNDISSGKFDLIACTIAPNRCHLYTTMLIAFRWGHMANYHNFKSIDIRISTHCFISLTRPTKIMTFANWIFAFWLTLFLSTGKWRSMSWIPDLITQFLWKYCQLKKCL